MFGLCVYAPLFLVPYNGIIHNNDAEHLIDFFAEESIRIRFSGVIEKVSNRPKNILLSI